MTREPAPQALGEEAAVAFSVVGRARPEAPQGDPVVVAPASSRAAAPQTEPQG